VRRSRARANTSIRPGFRLAGAFCHGTTATGNLVLRTAAFVVLWLFAVWLFSRLRA
jgi:hypothetical protein